MLLSLGLRMITFETVLWLISTFSGRWRLRTTTLCSDCGCQRSFALTRGVGSISHSHDPRLTQVFRS